MTSTEQQIQEVYIGLLGRAADKEGLDYWSRQIYLGALTIEQLRANIVNEQPEYQLGLGTLSRLDTIIELYHRLFAREPESEGLQYWATGDGSGVNIDQLVFALSEGASAVDRRAIENKTVAASYYTENIPFYDETTAQEAVIAVDDNPNTVTTAISIIDEFLNAQGETFELQAGTDILTGTAANDIFHAIGGNTAVTNNTDQLDGGAGNDTLKIDSSGDSNTVVGFFTNIEHLLFTGDGRINNDDSIDLARFAKSFTLANTTDNLVEVSGVTEQSLKLDQVAGNTTLSSIFGIAQETAHLGFSALQGNASVQLSGSSLNTVNITVDEAFEGTANVTDTGDTLITTNIDAKAAGSIFINAAQLQSVTLSGTGHVRLTTSTGPTLEVDASASTGGVTVESVLANNALFTGSSASDTVTFGATTKANRLGAGNDTAIVDSVLSLGINGEIDAGSGTDTLQTTAATAANLSATNVFSGDIAGFEKLILTEATSQSVNMSNLDDLNDITLTGNGNTLTLNNLAANSTITFTDSSTQTALNMLNATSQNNDQLNIKLSSSTTLSAGTITANKIETIAIDSDDTDENEHINSATLSADALTTLILGGDSQLNLSLIGTSSLSTVDASTHSAGVMLDISQTDSIQLSGSSGSDTITLGNLDSVTGGSGDDTYTVKAAIDKTSFATVSDFQQGDSVGFFGVTDTTDASTFNTTGLSLEAGSSFDQFLDTATAGTTAQPHAVLSWFLFEGNTYLVNDRSAEETFQENTDQAIILSGVFDLSNASVLNGVLTLV